VYTYVWLCRRVADLGYGEGFREANNAVVTAVEVDETVSGDELWIYLLMEVGTCKVSESGAFPPRNHLLGHVIVTTKAEADPLEFLSATRIFGI